MNISVVIPIYNSELSLPLLIERLKPVLESLTDMYEVILVNDASTDRSWNVICGLCDTNEWVRGINLMRNYGQHNALLCGIQLATHEIIVNLDDDLQNPPEEIPKLIKKLEEGYDVVYGTPDIQQHGVFRNIASKITKLALQSAMGIDTARNVSAFRVFRTKVRDAFSDYKSPFVSIDVLLTWGTKNFSAVKVQHHQRELGKSNYTVKKLTLHALNMMTGYSTMPLQIASLMGFGLTLFGLCILAYVIGRYFIHGVSVPGFPFIASIIAIFSGAQLFALGIIGEYLARMHFRTMGRPQSVIRQVIGFKL